MQRPAKFTSPDRRASRTLTLALIAALAAGSVHAQTGVLVQDAIQEKTSTASYLFQKITQYAKQVQQYETQVQQYQQMLTKAMNLGTDFSIMPNTMTEMDAGPLIQANCSSNTGSIIGNFVNQITTSLMSQSVVKSQLQNASRLTTFATAIDRGRQPS